MEIDESKILITGGSGRLGKACKKIMPTAMYPTREDMDIRENESVRGFFDENKPEFVLHLAAKTGIPPCENDKKDAWASNVVGTRNLVEAARDTGSVKLFVYLDTACIFPGDDGEGSYDEDSLPNPKHFYGLTKLIGEEVAKSYNSSDMQVTIVRTNFTCMPWEYPKAFTDRFSTYLFAQGVAKGLLDLVREMPKLPVVHICGDRKISMYEYAKAGGSDVEPMTMDDYHGPPLTKNMCLTSKCWRLYKLEDSDWDDS